MQIPPPLPTPAKRVKHIEIIKASRKAEFGLFIIGILTLVVFGLGLIFILAGIIVSVCKHDTKIVSYRCSACGNQVADTSTICPTCKNELIN